MPSPPLSLSTTLPGRRASSLLAVALALSIGWGVRGNWGHEYGAMIPGALSAMAAAIVSGREDWRRRVAYFAFFGALGWSFGGSMSYGRVLGYAHSDSLPDVLYGFACTYAIGFLWGAIGGAGLALPACLDRKRLTEFFPPLIAIFAVWVAWDYVLLWGLLRSDQAKRLNWHGADWIGAGSALLILLGFLVKQRRPNFAVSLMLWMAAGWWLGMLALVEGLGLHMTPPRSDNWAGCVGMAVAMLWFLRRRGLDAAIFAALAIGLAAGLGFATGLLIRVAGHASKIPTNWHSVMEQSFGFIAGLGAAIVMGHLSTRLPQLAEERDDARWTESFAVLFVLLGITYVNIVKNVLVDPWIPNRVVPAEMYGIPAYWWFNFAYLALAALTAALVLAHPRRNIAALPATALGRAQVMMVVFLWWIVIGNLSRYLPFHPVRLVTEGVIHLNACVLTGLMLLAPRQGEEPALAGELPRAWIKRAASAALAAGVCAALLYTAVVLPLQEAPDAAARFRFGARALEGW